MQRLRLLRERTSASLQECREALDASSGDIDAAAALIQGRQAPATFCHCGVRRDQSFAILLEVAGAPSAEAHREVEALLQTALLADDDATAASALSHPVVRRYALARLPPNQTGIVGAAAVDKGAAAVVMVVPSAEQAASPDEIRECQDLAARALSEGYRYANASDVPEQEIASWLERARGTDADKEALLRTVALSADPEVARYLQWTYGTKPRTLLAVHRIDAGSNGRPDSLRDVSPCLVRGPLVVVGRAMASKMSVGAIMDFSDCVRRWGDDHRIATSLIAPGTSSAWHTLHRDEVITTALVVGVVVVRGPMLDCTMVDRALCLSSKAALDAVPAAAFCELASVLPDAERAELVKAPSAVHVAAIGAMDVQLVFGKRGTSSATRGLQPARGGGPAIEFYKSGETRDLRAYWPGVRGELVASADVGCTAVANLSDAVHAARAQRLPRMQYYVVPSFEVEVDDLR